MKFGQVDNPHEIDFTLPPDHPDTAKVLKAATPPKPIEVYVGCSKWHKKDLQNFFPIGVRDELAYYATQFNCIELNATFYRLLPLEHFEKWFAEVPEDFRFFPKLEKKISHFQRLKDVGERVAQNVDGMSHLREKLEMPYLQMHDNFGPRDFERVAAFVEDWTYEVPLAIEFRHPDWFNNADAASKLYGLLESRGVTNVLVDTAGRRDLMHMRLTTPTAFIRWVGVGDFKSDCSRLDEWVGRIAEWKKVGLQKLVFFVHQHEDQEVPRTGRAFHQASQREDRDGLDDSQDC